MAVTLPEPQVSVVMAVRNGGGRLSGSINTILNQEEVALELIIVDDGSTDGSARLLDEYARREARVWVEHVPRSGQTAGLIRGCERARGAYIARQDAGDVSVPNRLRKQRDWLAAHPDTVLVSCGVRVLAPRGEHLYDVMSEHCRATEDLRTLEYAQLRGPAHHGSVMFRRAAYRAVGGYRSAFYFAQDLDLWVRLVERGQHAVVPEILYEAVVEPDSISGRYRREQVRLTRLILESARRRRAGIDEVDVLERARAIRPVLFGPRCRAGARRAAALYFIGSCLRRRGDRAATSYFLAAVRENPLHLRSWYRLLL